MTQEDWSETGETSPTSSARSRFSASICPAIMYQTAGCEVPLPGGRLSPAPATQKG